MGFRRLFEHAAAQGGAISLHYQPTIEHASGTILYLEALLRWPYMQRFAPIPEIIRVAEESNNLHRLGAWALDRALSDIRGWQHFGCATPVGLNVSPSQIRSPFDEFVLASLQAVGMHPSQLIIEVTENGKISNLADFSRTLRNLSRSGVRIALDDFGTGYLNLAHLLDINVDYLKIDRRFTKLATEDKNPRLFRALQAIAHELGAKVITEGVENREQLEIVCALGSEYWQGYLHSKPSSANDVSAALRSGRWVFQKPEYPVHQLKHVSNVITLTASTAIAAIQTGS